MKRCRETLNLLPRWDLLPLIMPAFAGRTLFPFLIRTRFLERRIGIIGAEPGQSSVNDGPSQQIYPVWVCARKLADELEAASTRRNHTADSLLGD
jgi:hypothetical protein